MNKLITFLVGLLVILPAMAVQVIQTPSATATRIPIVYVDTNGAVVDNGTSDCEVDEWDHGGNPDGFVDATNEATEIGTTNRNYLQLTTTETDSDYTWIKCTTDTTDAMDVDILRVTISTIGDILDESCSTHTTNSTLGAICNDWENGGRLDLILDTINSGTLDAAGLVVLQAMMDNIILCTVDDTNFAPTTVAVQADCVDVDGGAWTADAGQNKGSLIMSISGANTNDRRFIFSTTVDTSQLRVTVATPDAWDDAMVDGDQFYIIPF